MTIRFILFLIILVALTSSSINAQRLGLHYNSTGSGENVTMTWCKLLERGAVGVGLGVNINQIKQPDDQNNLYYKRLYATEPWHFINVNVFGQRMVFPQLKKVSSFLFYDLQIKHSTTRSSLYVPYVYDPSLVIDEPEQGILYRQFIENFGPFTWVENGMGIGFNIDILENIQLQQQFGGGIYFILGYDDQILNKTDRWFEWEFMYFYSIGITYTFGSPA